LIAAKNFSSDYFGEIHRQSYQDVVSFFLNTAIPLTLELYGLVNSTQSMTPMKDILEFLYSQNVPVNDKDMLLKNVVKVTRISQSFCCIMHRLYMQQYAFLVVRPRLSSPNPNISKPRFRTANSDF
jgi:hypothetical protein